MNLRAVGLGLVLVASVTGPGDAQEKVVLTTPIQASPGATEFSPWTITLRVLHPDIPQAELVVLFREVSGTPPVFVAQGKQTVCRFEGDAATTALRTLNTANLTMNSLSRRVVTQCQMAGQLGAGAIVGTPIAP